jgi:hypothetical protein
MAKLLLFFLICSLTFYGLTGIPLAILQESATQQDQERVFLDLSLELLDQYELPQQKFDNTDVGGLSAISYDRQKDLFYAVSDDRSKLAPARFYTLKIDLNQSNLQAVNIDKIEVKNVTFLKNKQGENYPINTIDPEGIAISPRHTVFVSSEGNTLERIPPSIAEFDFNGNFQREIRIPQRYLPNEQSEPLSKGVQNNLGFEALTIKANGTGPEDPFRLFVGTEAALTQDFRPEIPKTQNNSRLLHYVINPFGETVLIGENIYTVDSASPGVVYNGLTELITLPQEGYLLSLERTFGLGGGGAKIFQVVVANATDTSNIEVLDANTNEYTPLKKQLVLNLKQLKIPLENLEGMTLGPRLQDGSQSLIVISDNNFSQGQKNQFLLFKLVEY